MFNYIDDFPLDKSISGVAPSWVPHWHMTGIEHDEPETLASIFAADDDTIPYVETVLDDIDHGRLTVPGYVVDTLSECLTTTTPEALLDGERTCHLIEDIRGLLKGRFSAVDARALGTTLVAGTNSVRERLSEDECNDFSAWSTYIEEFKQIPGMPGSNKAPDGNDAKVSAYDYAVWHALRNRRFFITTSGFMGLGPRTMQPQDQIAVLHGCRWPVILRPGDDHFKMLGTCYVHGIMDGEAIREKKNEGKEAAVIIIR